MSKIRVYPSKYKFEIWNLWQELSEKLETTDLRLYSLLSLP